MLLGQFLPKDLQKRWNVVFLGEKPSMYFVRKPDEASKGNYNATATDKFFQDQIRKFLGRAVYITDMVKTEGRAGANFADEWRENPKFAKILLRELESIKPILVVAISNKVYSLFSGDKRFKKYMNGLRKIYHPAYVVRYGKLRIWRSQFKKLAHELHSV